MGSKTRKALNFDFSTKDIQNNMIEMEINGTYRKAYNQYRMTDDVSKHIKQQK